jgi:hypothetical protein
MTTSPNTHLTTVADIATGWTRLDAFQSVGGSALAVRCLC